MITRISIENFKGIGDQKVIVPIRPITLLFGPNSAGKSTIMHAVHYAREVLERHNLDADQTVAGGECVNLGGFREMVHRKENDRQIKLRFDLDLSGVAWHEQFPVDEFLHGHRVGTGYSDLSTLGLDVMSGWVELTIGFDDPDRASQPVVLKYTVGLDDQHLASLVHVPYKLTSDGIDRGALLTELNLYHPALAWPDLDADSLGPVDFYCPQFRGLAETVYFDDDVEIAGDDELQDLAAGKHYGDQVVSVLKSPESFEPGTIRRAERLDDRATVTIWVGKSRETGRLGVCAASSMRFPGAEDADAERIISYLASLVGHQPAGTVVLGLTDALPPLDRALQIELEEMDHDEEESSESHSEGEASSLNFVRQLLSRLIVGPGRFLRDYLTRFRYVGPIREVPPSEHLPPRYPDPSRWASGLAAWDLLSEPGSNSLVEGVSNWLWNDDLLDTGYQLVAKQVREIEHYLQDRMLRVEWEEGKPSELVEDILAELELLPERQRVYVRDVEKAVDLSACSVGLGIAQVVPVVVAVLADTAAVVQLEQPGLHLHPTQQAAIGDLLIEGALAEPRKILLVETHSEHMILRILRRIRQTHQRQPFKGIAIRPEDVISLYVEPRGGQTSAFEIAIGEDGEFLQPWPDKFFDQDYEERYG